MTSFFFAMCVKEYVELKITEGAYAISCPDAQCNGTGVLSVEEIASLVPPELMEKYHKFHLNRNVSMDGGRAWCPRPGCETICSVPINGTDALFRGPISCYNCAAEFCLICREPWHNTSCLGFPPAISFDNIKYCPNCAVPIEMNGGCAEMKCINCQHIFCWHCLASLKSDYFMVHYSKGPCKNKSGHPRDLILCYRSMIVFSIVLVPTIYVLFFLLIIYFFIE